MGQAKRRKQNDPTYGKVPFLGTERDRHKCFTKMIVDLHSECDLEIKTLASFDKVSDKEYKQIVATLDMWIKNRFLDYDERDREQMANSLLNFMYETLEKLNFNSNPRVLMCFVDILKSYISLHVYETLSEVVEDITEYIGSAKLIN